MDLKLTYPSNAILKLFFIFIKTKGLNPTIMSSSRNTSCKLLPNSALEVLVELEGDNFIVEFLSQMIFHHLEGIQMSKKILKMSRNVNVRREAEMIIESQSPQIDQMTDWLYQWYNMPPLEKSKELIESDVCLSKMLTNKMDDKQFIVETIQHHHLAHIMSLLLLQRITPHRFPYQAPQLQEFANEIIKGQTSQIQRLLLYLQDL